MSPASEGQGEVAAYVATLSAELSLISRRNGLATLAYLLDLARLEADNLARIEGGAAREDGLSAPGS